MTCGMDMLEISRMEKSLQSAHFISRVFGERERQLFEGHKNMAARAAANFCAKEAFSKALGTGIRGFALCEVEVLRDSLGKPYFVFSGNAAQLVEKSGLSFDVSLTHTMEYAGAMVIAFPTDFAPNSL
ncbi:holo-ACP synthase [Oscillospiraceae bacterium MB08-C2-2]|nr:holo-ACP synthase [Oscillospiraceae bacterium MB08-C2-2]